VLKTLSSDFQGFLAKTAKELALFGDIDNVRAHALEKGRVLYRYPNEVGLKPESMGQAPGRSLDS
jgi:hypothetical protein